jgi:hypothetical protein
MATQIISTPTIIDNISLISYDISWTGTAPVGMMSVQVSNTYTQNAEGQTANPGNWTTLTLSAPTPVTGNTGNGGIDVDVTGFYAIRLVYTPTSGTGLMNATINAKVC